MLWKNALRLVKVDVAESATVTTQNMARMMMGPFQGTQRLRASMLLLYACVVRLWLVYRSHKAEFRRRCPKEKHRRTERNPTVTQNRRELVAKVAALDGDTILRRRAMGPSFFELMVVKKTLYNCSMLFVCQFAVPFHAFLCVSFHIGEPRNSVCTTFLRTRQLLTRSCRDSRFEHFSVLVDEICARFYVRVECIPSALDQETTQGFSRSTCFLKSFP